MIYRGWVIGVIYRSTITNWTRLNDLTKVVHNLLLDFTYPVSQDQILKQLIAMNYTVSLYDVRDCVMRLCSRGIAYYDKDNKVYLK